jgi:hypothetical protein
MLGDTARQSGARNITANYSTEVPVLYLKQISLRRLS